MIKSFEIDHTRLKKGVYVSRVDGDITTIDIRVCAPYEDVPMTSAAAHTIEHVIADLLSNSRYKEKVIYFGPMGCLTGFYLLLKGQSDVENVADMLVRPAFEYLLQVNEIPGSSQKECGNYSLHDLKLAKKYAKKFLKSRWRLDYPR